MLFGVVVCFGLLFCGVVVDVCLLFCVSCFLAVVCILLFDGFVWCGSMAWLFAVVVCCCCVLVLVFAVRVNILSGIVDVRCRVLSLVVSNCSLCVVLVCSLMVDVVCCCLLWFVF